MNTNRHKKRIIRRGAFALCVLLALGASVPAQASVWESLRRFFSPFAQKIAKPSPDAASAAQNDAPSGAAKNAAPLDYRALLLQDANQTPDLLTLLAAEFAADRDDPRTALALYKQQSFADNATAVFERALGLSLQLESPRASLDFAKAWQEQNPDHIPALFYVAHLALKAEDYAAATQKLRAVLDYDPKADLGRIFAGITPVDPTSKATLFAALQELPDENASLSVLKAGLLMQLGEPMAALLHLDTALKDDPNHLAYLTLKADLLSGMGDDDALRDFLDAAILASDGDTKKQLYMRLARHFIDKGDLVRAWETLKDAHNAFADDTQILLLAGLVAVDISEHQAARGHFAKLAAYPSMQAQADYYTAISFEREGDYPNALAYFRRVRDAQWALPAAQKQVAYALLLGDTDAAIAAAWQLRQDFEMYASESYTLQASALLHADKKADAKALLKDAYALYPDDYHLLYAYAQLLSDDDEYAQKRAHLQTLLEYDPDNARYRFENARLVLLRDKDLLSVDAIERVGQMNPSDIGYDPDAKKDAIVWLAGRALDDGRYADAAAYLEPVYRQSGDRSVGALLLRAYRGLQYTQAIDALLHTLQENAQTP